MLWPSFSWNLNVIVFLNYPLQRHTGKPWGFPKLYHFESRDFYHLYTVICPFIFKYLKINTQICLEPACSFFPWGLLFLNCLLSLTWGSALNGFVFSLDSSLVLPVLNTHPDTFTVSLDGVISRSLEGASIKRLFNTA